MSGRLPLLAVAVLALIAALFASSRLLAPVARPAGAPPAPIAATRSRLVTVEIGGMTCAGCVDKIQRSVAAVPGVRRVEVSLASQRAEVLCDGGVADTALTAAVRRAGPQYLGLVLAP
jgi:copper chaperone CopZ